MTDNAKKLLENLKSLNNFLVRNIDTNDSHQYVLNPEDSFELVITRKQLKLLQNSIGGWINDIEEKEDDKINNNYIITAKDIEYLSKNFDSFSNQEKFLFIKREFLKWIDCKNSDQNGTVGEFKKSLIGKDIRNGTYHDYNQYGRFLK